MAVDSNVELLMTLDIFPECTRPMPKSMGPKHQAGGRLVERIATKLSRVVGLDSYMNNIR